MSARCAWWPEYPSEWAAIGAVAQKLGIGCSKTLQKWIRQAEALFTEASGGATLHQLRHSAVTHDAEDGTGTPMLMASSGHTSVRSLAKYARVSAEALQRHQEMTDPGAHEAQLMARRRRRYRGPHPYARMGCLGPSVGCSGCLIVLVAAVAVVVALLAGALA